MMNDRQPSDPTEPPPAGARLPLAYRCITSARDEGFEFQLVLDAVADFYIHEMGGQAKHDGPDARIKFTRDWEYPWVLGRSEIHPGQRALDCGSGYSPVPFLWAKHGAEAHAIDRDAIVCSRVRYAGRVFADWLKGPLGAEASGPVSERPPGLVTAPARRARSNALPAKALRFFAYHYFRKHRAAFRRAVRPDFWGPVSPALLDKYGVRYVTGDFTHLEYPAEHFDVVACVSVLEHMREDAQRRGIREMARVLRRGGRMIITYDKQDSDLTGRFIEESGCAPLELVYLAASRSGQAACADVIGMLLVK